MFKSTHYTKSFLHIFPDKENNPNSLNSQGIHKLKSKPSIDITEKMQKMSQLTMKTQDYSKDILKKLIPEGNKKVPLQIQEKKDLVSKELRDLVRLDEKNEKSPSKAYSYSELENARLNNVYSKEILEVLRKNEVNLRFF